MERVLILDPGKTTGYAIFHKSSMSGKFYLDSTGIIAWKDWALITELIFASNHVVFENVTSSGPQFKDHGIQVIGVVKYLCHQANIGYEKQQPAMRKPAFVWGENVIKHLPTEHEKDAVAHGLVYFGLKRLDRTQL